MDPFLEQFWGDVHARMIVYLSDQLQPQMPQGLVVRIEEYTSVKEVDEEAKKYSVPDIHVLERSRRGAKRRANGAAVAEPFVIELPKEPRTLKSVRVLDTTLGKRVVTAVEVLSPVNKTSRAGRDQYERRREKLVKDSSVNLVEIDLLLSGSPLLLVPAELMPYEYYHPYRITVLRSHGERHLEMYKASFRERLPVIPIPLRAKDEDAVLDVQALVEQCYAAGPGRLIDYRQQVRPRLYGPDADWVDALLRKKGLR
jgi:hypothetical protein